MLSFIFLGDLEDIRTTLQPAGRSVTIINSRNIKSAMLHAKMTRVGFTVPFL